MRLLQLRFGAVGPFAGEHCVDLEALGAHGLFLLEGPTGAGKTTLIDAIVFALYGDVSGEESSKQRIVSTHRASGSEPFVELTFETGSGIYRVRRTPEFERPKQRGTGTTRQNATCRFYTLPSPDAEPTLVTGHVQQANDELRTVVGLTKAQFTQTVVLPQGQFASFLRAKPDERRGLLQDIFGTQLFQDVQEQLQELAKRHRAAVEKAAATVEHEETALLRVAWGEDGPGPLSDGQTIDDAVTRRLATLDAESHQARTRETEATRAREQAAAALRAEEAAQTALRQRAELRARRATLEAAQPSIDAHAAELAAAQRAEVVRNTLTAHERAVSAGRRADAAAGHASIEARHDPEIAAAVDASSPTSALRALSAGWRTRVGELRPLTVMAAGFDERERQLASTRDRIAAETAEADEQQQTLARYHDLLAAEQGRLERLRAQADELPAAAEALREAQASVESHRRHAHRVEIAAGLERSREETRALAAAAKAHYDQLHARWLGATASRLAAELAAGDACPVCGSTEHPDLASAPDAAVDDASLDAAQQELEAANSTFATARAAAAQAATAVAESTAELAGADLELAAADLQRARERHDAVAQAVRDAQALDRELQRRRQRYDGHVSDLAEERTRLAAAAARWEADALALAADRAQVADAVPDGESIAATVTSLTHRIQIADRAAKAIDDARHTAEVLATAESDLARALAEQSFADAAALEGALRPAARRAELQRAVAAHEREVAEVAGLLSSPSLAALAEDATADPAPLAAALALADEACQASIEQRVSLERTRTAVADQLAELGRARAHADELTAASRPYVDMANLARGDNPRHLTLATYVLLRRFEEIVERANSRLAAMTGGRYELLRTDEKDGGHKRAGLGLAVVDHASHDVVRDPRTLSGGETFLASLALALGLAEAVTAEAGGLELHTLFIDEGFGTLDPDALDLVMHQLGKLRAGGRAVGIISHVAELKQQISERVSVRRLPSGGSTLTTTADASARYVVGASSP